MVNESAQRGHGRQENRKVEAWSVTADFTTGWQDLQSFTRVTRWGVRGGKDYWHQMFYMTSLPPQAQKLARVIRQHWQIENNLHWVKDVLWKEDQALQKKGNAP